MSLMSTMSMTIAAKGVCVYLVRSDSEVYLDGCRIDPVKHGMKTKMTVRHVRSTEVNEAGGKRQEERIQVGWDRPLYAANEDDLSGEDLFFWNGRCYRAIEEKHRKSGYHVVAEKYSSDRRAGTGLENATERSPSSPDRLSQDGGWSRPAGSKAA